MEYPDYGTPAPKRSKTLVQPDPRTPEQITGLPMKWYKFLNEVVLLLAALFNFANGALAFAQSFSAVPAGSPMAGYFPTFRLVNALFSLLLMGLGAFMLYTRSRLVHRRTNAPICLYLCFAGNAAWRLCFVLVMWLVLSGTEYQALYQPQPIEVGQVVVATAVLVLLNLRYFKRRAALFVNP